MKKTKAIIITISLVTMGTVGLIGAYFMNRTKAYANAESKEIYNETETDTETIEAKTEKDNKDDNKSDQVGKADCEQTRACTCAYYSCRWICPSDGSCYTKIQVGTETVQVGTEKVKVGTKHHDEERHWECSCGAIK